MMTHNDKINYLVLLISETQKEIKGCEKISRDDFDKQYIEMLKETKKVLLKCSEDLRDIKDCFEKSTKK